LLRAARAWWIVLCVPTRLDPVSFTAMPDRPLMICGEGGLDGRCDRARPRGSAVRGASLAGYDSGWADVVADRTDDRTGNVGLPRRAAGRCSARARRARAATPDP
jgi:hypothetical protein